MAVSKRLRYEILRRDNHACRYCGATTPDVPLTVDHVVPTTLGGSDDPTNLVTACAPCNSGKSATPADAALVADVEQDALRWSRAMAEATTRAGVHRDAVMAATRNVVDLLDFAVRYLPVSASDSIEQFMRNGLTADDLQDAAYTTLGATYVTAASAWRYFCGVCWRKIERRQDEARAILHTEQTPPPTQRPAQNPDYAAIYPAIHLGSVCDGAILRAAGLA